MRVIECKQLQFPLEVRCEHCCSLLEVEIQDCTHWYDSEKHEDAYEFTCPCCDGVNRPSPEVVVCGNKFFSHMTFIFENRIGSVAFREEKGEVKGISEVRNDIFQTAANIRIAITDTCRTCKHRGKSRLSDWSSKVVQYCELQPSKRSNSGYKTIKVTDKACKGYERS